VHAFNGFQPIIIDFKETCVQFTFQQGNGGYTMAGKPKAEKDKSERWLLTYADLMNLLLILFIVLYSLGQTDKLKAEAVAIAIQQGFNESPSKIAALQTYWNNSNNSSNNSSNSSNTEYSNFYDKLMKLIRDNGLQDKVTVMADDRGVVISFSDNVLFASGSAELSTEAKNLAISIGNIIKQVSYSQMLIEGNTDSDPIHTVLYQDNLALSSARADNVNRIFKYDCGIDPKTMSSLGNGENKPVAPNDTPTNKAKNRRVVITILRQILDTNAVISADKLVSALNVASSAANQAIAASSAKAFSSSKTTTASKSTSNTANTSTSKVSTSGSISKSTSSK
jgi:chemotaxis protein MotB